MDHILLLVIKAKTALFVCVSANVSLCEQLHGETLMNMSTTSYTDHNITTVPQTLYNNGHNLKCWQENTRQEEINIIDRLHIWSVLNKQYTISFN